MRLSLILGGLSSFNIILNFLFQWYIFTHVGPGVETDALFAGLTIPQLILTVVSGSLMHVLVPLLAGESEDRSRHDAWGFFLLIGGVFSLFALLLYLTAPWWVSLTVPGFSRAGQTLTVKLTSIQLAGMVFTALTGVQWAVYHSKQKFLWAEMSPILGNGIAVLLLIWVLPHYGIVGAAWISTLRYAIQTVVMLPALGTFVCPNFKAHALKEAWRRMKPLLIGTIYYKTDPLVDRFLLSMSTSGTLSLYYLGQQIYGAANTVLNRSVAAPLVPKLSTFNKAGDRDGFKDAYQNKLFQITLLCGASIILFIIIGKPLLGILVGRGSFRASNVSMLWLVMIGLSGAFLGGVGGQITSSAFYARGNTRTPTAISIITFTLFIPMKIASFYIWNVMGVAVATSIYYLSNLLLINYYLRRELLGNVKLQEV
jgi:putative peptidoglycan lipid II flippase